MRPKERDSKELLRRLDHQDKQLEQVIWNIKGNPDLNIEGLMPAVKRVEQKMVALEAWKASEDSRRGKIEVRDLFRWVGGVTTVTGGVLGIIELCKYVFR